MMELKGDNCECTVCRLQFKSTLGFDKHRSGAYGTPERRCLTVDEMLAKGMAVNSKGFWVTKLRSESTIPS